MGIGGGIALIVIGAILAFGVSDNIANVDLTVIGYICMGAGVLALILALVLTNQRANTSHREVVERYDGRTPPPAACPGGHPPRPERPARHDPGGGPARSSRVRARPRTRNRSARVSCLLPA